MNKLLAYQAASTATLGAVAGYAVMGLNPVAGAAIALTVHLVNEVAHKAVLSLKPKQSLARGFAPLLYTPSLIAQGGLIQSILKCFSSSLPLFHAYTLGMACTTAGKAIGSCLNQIKLPAAR